MEEILEKLGITREPVEIILTTYFPNSKIPNAAPMGLEYQNQKLIFHIYEETDTYKNLIANEAGVVNVTRDLKIFANAAIKKQFQLNEFERADVVNAPRLKAADGFIEFIPTDFFDYMKKDDLGESEISKVEAKIEKIYVKNFVPVFKRNTSPSLRAIIVATKLQVALGRNKEVIAKKLRKKLEETITVAKNLPKEKRAAEYIEKLIQEYSLGQVE
ncbi:MAG: DUF447 family protein [Euryarchaeota archaeon]|nr:DUF447 family protein [Euryarchaeota archaeon]